MTSHVGIVFVHGIGDENIEFSLEMRNLLRQSLAQETVKMVDVYWADLFEAKQQQIARDAHNQGLTFYELDFPFVFNIRGFLLSHLADTIAYQIYQPGSPGFRQHYDAVHSRFATAVHDLVEELIAEEVKDAENTPLIVVSHSLGSVIASNYYYDLQKNIFVFNDEVEFDVRRPIERGETLAALFTMGSPLKLYNMRYTTPAPYGLPIDVPAPQILERFPDVKEAFQNAARYWVNFYDKEDLIGYPLSDLNDMYGKVIRDKKVEISNWQFGWTPLAHLGYWKHNEVIDEIVTMVNHILAL